MDSNDVLTNEAIKDYKRYWSIKEYDDMNGSVSSNQKAGETEVIVRFQSVLRHIPHTHKERLNLLQILETVSTRRYMREKVPSDEEVAIFVLQQAFEEMPKDSSYGIKLFQFLTRRSQRLGFIENIDQMILLSRKIAHLHRGDQGLAFNVVTLYYRRYCRTVSPDHCQSAIDSIARYFPNLSMDNPFWIFVRSLQQDLLELRSPKEMRGDISDLELAVNDLADNDRWKAFHLDKIGNMYRNRYLRTGLLSDLRKSLGLMSKSINLSGQDDPDLARRYDNLGLAYQSLYKRDGELATLQETISYFKSATKNARACKSFWLEAKDHLGGALILCFLRNDLQDDLEESVKLRREVVKDTLDNDPALASRKNGLATSLKYRSQRRGSVQDLQEAIDLFQEAVELCPRSHPSQSTYVANQSAAILDKYRSSGALKDLESGLSACHGALDQIALGHWGFALWTHNLGLLLLEHHTLTRRSIKVLAKSVKETPTADPSRDESRNSLAVAYRSRYLRTRSIDDLDEAISIAEGLVNEESIQNNVESTNQQRYRGNLAACLHDRYHKSKEIRYLEKCVDNRKSILSYPIDNPISRAEVLFNLCRELQNLSQHQGTVDSIDQAIDYAHEAIKLTQTGYAGQARFFDAIANAYEIRAELTKSPEDRRCALGFYLKSLEQPGSDPLTRLISGRKAAVILVTFFNAWKEGAECFDKTTTLVSQIAPRSNTLEDHQYVLYQLKGVASFAASVLLKAEKSPLKSLQILERFRGVVSGLVIDSRNDVSALRDQYPQLYQRFQNLRESLASSNSSQPLADGGFTSLLLRQSAMIKDLETVEREIRAISGFETFQQAFTKQELLELARDGPIVSMNVSVIESHAFLITTSDVRVRKLSITYKAMNKWMSRRFPSSNRAYRNGDVMEEDDPMMMEQENVPLWNEIERDMLWLWDSAVKPVLEDLGLIWEQTPPDSLPHVRWVGGGSMAALPLHAAGDHRPGSTENTMSHVISSYVPTLKALQFSQHKKWRPIAPGNDSIVIVSAPGFPPLNVATESEAIRQCVGFRAVIDSLENPALECVLPKLTACTMAHFACHAKSDPLPSRSGLELGSSAGMSKRLTVNDLQPLSQQLAQVAYLSACSTAHLGSRDLVEEGIHLASTFQLVGFRHVIGTLWDADDAVAVEVAGKFYQNLFRDTKSSSPVPKALHDAILYARGEGREGDVEWLRRWATFIHVGP